MSKIYKYYFYCQTFSRFRAVRVEFQFCRTRRPPPGKNLISACARRAAVCVKCGPGRRARAADRTGPVVAFPGVLGRYIGGDRRDTEREVRPNTRRDSNLVRSNAGGRGGTETLKGGGSYRPGNGKVLAPPEERDDPSRCGRGFRARMVFSAADTYRTANGSNNYLECAPPRGFAPRS